MAGVPSSYTAAVLQVVQANPDAFASLANALDLLYPTGDVAAAGVSPSPAPTVLVLLASLDDVWGTVAVLTVLLGSRHVYLVLGTPPSGPGATLAAEYGYASLPATPLAVDVVVTDLYPVPTYAATTILLGSSIAQHLSDAVVPLPASYAAAQRAAVGAAAGAATGGPAASNAAAQLGIGADQDWTGLGQTAGAAVGAAVATAVGGSIAGIAVGRAIAAASASTTRVLPLLRHESPTLAAATVAGNVLSLLNVPVTTWPSTLPSTTPAWAVQRAVGTFTGTAVWTYYSSGSAAAASNVALAAVGSAASGTLSAETLTQTVSRSLTSNAASNVTVYTASNATIPTYGVDRPPRAMYKLKQISTNSYSNILANLTPLSDALGLTGTPFTPLLLTNALFAVYDAFPAASGVSSLLVRVSNLDAVWGPVAVLSELMHACNVCVQSPMTPNRAAATYVNMADAISVGPAFATTWTVAITDSLDPPVDASLKIFLNASGNPRHPAFTALLANALYMTTAVPLRVYSYVPPINLDTFIANAGSTGTVDLVYDLAAMYASPLNPYRTVSQADSVSSVYCNVTIAYDIYCNLNASGLTATGIARAVARVHEVLPSTASLYVDLTGPGSLARNIGLVTTFAEYVTPRNASGTVVLSSNSLAGSPATADVAYFLSNIASRRSSNPLPTYDVVLLDSLASVPDAPSVASITAANATVTLSAAPPLSRSSPIVGYSVAIGWSSNGSNVAFTPSLPYTASGLANGTPYSFAIAASNAVGLGPYSATRVGAVPAAGPPVTAEIGADPTTVSVSTRFSRFGYVVQQSCNGVATATVPTVYPVTVGVLPGTVGAFRAAACNAAGAGGYGASVSVSPPSVAPAPPVRAALTVLCPFGQADARRDQQFQSWIDASRWTEVWDASLAMFATG